MNRLLLVSHFVFLLLELGKPGSMQEFWSWKGNCGGCGRLHLGPNGLFCANFASPRSGWTACNSVWCGSCYRQPPNNLFHHAQPSDESGFHWRSDKDRDRHLFAHDGDHLITPFQCDLCAFHNLEGRNPTSQDDFLMACIVGPRDSYCWIHSSSGAANHQGSETGPFGPSISPFRSLPCG